MERLKILQNILPSGLIAESMSSLAAILGYKSRATLYRILDGSASTNAINDFYRRVETSLFLSEDTLHNINATIENATRLNKLLKWAPGANKSDGFDVLKAFISHDYTIFTDEFRNSELSVLQRLERTDPNAFFSMLAYFYFKSLRIDFHEGYKSYKERCAEILESIGRQLMELYPANGIAASTIYIYSRSEILNAEAPILWNFITTLATLLQYYGTPDIGNLIARDMLLVPFLSDRTYWRTNSQSNVILMREVKHNMPGSGYYDIFITDTNTGIVKSIGVITFLSEEIVSYRDKYSTISKLGMYQIDEDKLVFSWEKEDETPSGLGNHWKYQPLQHSQSLRDLDKYISNNKLNEAALRADGYKLLPEYSVINVILSRTGVRLSLANGQIYEISYTTAPFLEYIRPSNDVIIAEQINKGEIFVSWPQLMHCIPLRLFTPIKSTQNPYY